MSAIERAAQEPPVLEELPRFELSYLFDSEDDPSEVTIFPESDDFDISTNWITASVEGTVPLEAIR